jgi:hypothetical protein
VRLLLEAVKAEGFGPDAILWALVGAIINIMQGLGHLASEIENVTKQMLGRMNEARRIAW